MPLEGVHEGSVGSSPEPILVILLFTLVGCGLLAKCHVPPPRIAHVHEQVEPSPYALQPASLLRARIGVVELLYPVLEVLVGPLRRALLAW